MPSTVIRSFFYEPASRRLWVTFMTGRHYVYENLPDEVYRAFVAAPSRGRFFNLHIRAHYPFHEMVRNHRASGSAPPRRV